MVDASSIGAALSSLSAAKDIAKAALDAKTEAEVNARVVELHDVIRAAQESAIAANMQQLELLDRLQKAEAENRTMKAWEAEAERYEMVDRGGSTFAYALKDDHANGEPPHHLCPNCFTQQRKSILQHRHETYTGQSVDVCPACQTEFVFGAAGRSRF